MSKSITFKSKVGACIYTNHSCYSGFNIETKIHKGYHAEEVALISCLRHHKGSSIKGIVIAYDFLTKGIYPACAYCRQFLWELTQPNLLITVVDLNGEIIFEETLNKLYPYPYPLIKNGKYTN